ncbi:MAG TPA: BtrH N-terminal domain-containing protein [Symbiobacteriaceae bacterium]|nr:BtrH N-terminal domain-containing protein [Symbiobacteriaceae bacterium]
MALAVKPAVLLHEYPHRQSRTCRSGNIRDVLHAQGHDLTETMIFGLSNSLGFTYRLPHETSEVTDYLMLTGLWHRGVHDLIANLALDCYEYLPSDEASHWQRIRRQLEEGRPVMLEVVLAKYMHYLEGASLPGDESPKAEERERFVSDWDSFFSRLKRVAGTHVVVVVGLDEAANKAYVIENNLSRVQTVPLDVLKHASNPPEDLPLHPRGRFSVVRAPEQLPPLEPAIRKAIATTAHRMLHSTAPGDGVAGLERLAGEMQHWPERYPLDVVQNTLCLLYYLSEKASGGGMYRRLYGRFLHEAADLLQDDRMMQAAQAYYGLARQWRRFATLLLAGVTNPAETLQSSVVIEMVREIAAQERHAALLLQASAQG